MKPYTEAAQWGEGLRLLSFLCLCNGEKDKKADTGYLVVAETLLACHIIESVKRKEIAVIYAP